MLDASFGWEFFESITLENCAYCVDDKKFMACVKWGGSFLTDGTKNIFPINHTKLPSKTFKGALQKFNDYYKN